MPALARVVVELRAADEIDAIDLWWRANRATAADLFRQEIEQCFDALTAMPALGAVATNAGHLAVRRLLLARSRYHVYYRAVGDTIHVLAVWHASRGVAPAL